jgi:oxalate decarboxylase/phosphoglucose isomerase-like protein (cupin superfamily)
MKLPIVDENSIEAIPLSGRELRWIVTKETTQAQHCTMCVIHMQPGETARPAHSHPNGEEVIYIVQGSGRIMIDGVVEPVNEGCTVLIPQGKIHMLQNSGDRELKAACFFAPPSDLSTYRAFEDVQFPD